MVAQQLKQVEVDLAWQCKAMHVALRAVSTTLECPALATPQIFLTTFLRTVRVTLKQLQANGKQEREVALAKLQQAMALVPSSP